MDKKYLISCGDSFTAGHDMGSEASWAHWTADSLNLELINLASGGMSNEWISMRTLSYLQQNKDRWEDSVVMIGWTEMMRQMTFFDDLGKTKIGKWVWSAQPNDFTCDDWSEDTPGEWMYKHRKSLYPFFSNLPWALMKTYTSIMILKTFLDSKNIPYLFLDAVNDNKLYYENGETLLRDWDYKKEPFNVVQDHDMIGDIVNKEMVDYLFDEKYVDVDGVTLLHWIHKVGDERYCEGNGGHTNIYGAQESSKFIVKHYERIYGKRPLGLGNLI
jgi:hypothetical protein